MAKRINTILPDKTVSVLDRVTTKGNRSRFIDRAVLHYVETGGKYWSPFNYSIHQSSPVRV